ncbi:MAG: DUF885 domain-containing protein [Parvularculaceae bacterium]
MRNVLPVIALSALAACSPAKDAGKAPAADPGTEVGAVADDYLALLKTYAPFYILFSGLGEDAAVPNDAFDDNSPAGYAAYERGEDAMLARLHKIDPAQLKNRADWVAYETMKEALEASRGMRVCHQSWQSINHMFGWQNSLASIADMQPVETEEDRAAALARWEKLSAYIVQDQANLQTGLDHGYSVPKRVVARVIAQLDALIAAPAAELPFISFAAKGDDDFKAKAEALAADQIHPALVAYRAFLSDVYLPAARDALSISANPDGAACYEALLRGVHTADIGSEKTFARGEEAVATNTAAVIARGKEMFGSEDFADILAKVKTAPGNRFASEAELIDFTRAEADTAKQKVAPFFTKLPAQEMVVEPYADYLKGTGQSSRYEPTPPAQGAATYRINTDDWEQQTRGEAQIVVVHEGWPGHHLQIATAYETGDMHPIVQLLGSTAYIEGWARYAEALAEEAGIYDTKYGEITRRAWPARGMVMDPGLHVFGWTNDQVKEFAIASGRFDDKTAEVLLDRLAVIPGQLTAYDTGGLEIFALRREAEERLGDKFDIKAFHDRVLENGPVPLAALRAHVEEWIGETE